MKVVTAPYIPGWLLLAAVLIPAALNFGLATAWAADSVVPSKATAAVPPGSIQAQFAERRQVARQPSENFIIGINDFPASFNPNTESQGVKGYVQWMMYRPLTAYDRAWKLICILCDALPSLENRNLWYESLPNGESVVALRYRIRADAVWGDGVPVTTKDVLFTHEVGRNPAAGWVSLDFFAREIHSIAVEDERTFVLRRRSRACEAEQINSFLLLPAHIEGPVYQADPKTYRTRSRYETNSIEPGLWNGPYRPVSIRTGQEIILERNPRWTGKKPFFPRVTIRSMEQSRELEQALVDGRIDYVAGEYGFTAHQASQFQRRHGADFDIRWGHGVSYRQVTLDHQNPLFRDLRVRRAMLLALNRPLMNERLYYGRNVVAETDTNPRDAVYFADTRRNGFDPDEAGRLLDEAGWKMSADGRRRNSRGEPFQFELWAASGDRTIDLELQFLQEMWRALGITAQPRRAIPRVLFSEILPERRFGGAAVFSWVAAPRESPRSLLHSSQIPDQKNGFSGQNFLGYQNPEMDRLLDSMNESCTPPVNQPAWNRMQQLYAEDLPSLPLFYMASVFVYPKWLKGVEPSGHLFDSSLWIEEWRFEPQEVETGQVEWNPQPR
jgi:peptide/nickel transport system substrate-binding protein